MTLKCSEITNFLSWRDSTILYCFLVASASCHLALPHIIRPMLRVLKFVRTTYIPLEVFLSIQWIFWILSKNLTNFCSNRHASGHQRTFLAWRPDQYEWTWLHQCISVEWGMFLPSARGVELEVHCDDDRWSYLESTRSPHGLQRHLLILSVEALPVRLQVLHSGCFCCSCLAFAFAFLVVIAFLCVAVVTGGIVVGSSTWSPAVFRPISSSASSCTCWCLYCSCCLCCSCDFLSGVGVCLCPSPCLSWESRLASCCHHPHPLHFQLIRSDLLQSFGKSNTIATQLFSGTLGVCTQLQVVPQKIGTRFIVTVYLTASAKAVPDARSHSPTSSSQALQPDSKPSAWPHQSFASVMIFCIKAYCRFWVSGAYLLRIRRHASACLILQQIGQEFGHCLSWSKPTSNTTVCSTSNVHRPALARLPGRSDFVRLRICPSTVKRLCWRGSSGFGSWSESLDALHRFHRTKAACPGLSGPKAIRHQELPSYSKLCSFFVDLRFQRTGSATTYEYKMTVWLHLFLKTRWWDDLSQGLLRSKRERTENLPCIVQLICACLCTSWRRKKR